MTITWREILPTKYKVYDTDDNTVKATVDNKESAMNISSSFLLGVVTGFVFDSIYVSILVPFTEGLTR